MYSNQFSFFFARAYCLIFKAAQPLIEATLVFLQVHDFVDHVGREFQIRLYEGLLMIKPILLLKLEIG